MYGVQCVFVALTAIAVTQVYAQAPDVSRLILQELAERQLALIQRQQPTVTPNVTTSVWAKRGAYVELQCPLEGSSVVWTVISGQPDGIRFEKMLIFPRITGNFWQVYQCQALDKVALVKVYVVREIPSDTPETAEEVCEHGTICVLTCGDEAKWDGVTIIREVWTRVPWSKAETQAEPHFIDYNGVLSADVFTVPSRMMCSYSYIINEKGSVSGLPFGTKLFGQPSVIGITVNQPRPQIFTPRSFYSNDIVEPVCVGKLATIRCDGMVPASDIGADIFWLQDNGNGTTFIPDDPSLREESATPMTPESRLGRGISVWLIFDPVKPEHLRNRYICKIQSSVRTTYETMRIVARPEACV